MNKTLSYFLILLAGATSPLPAATDSASWYVAMAIHYESDRPLDPLPMEGYMHYAYDERDVANSFDFSAYLLQDTTDYLKNFPSPHARNLVKLFRVEQAWDVDSLAAHYAAGKEKSDFEQEQIPRVMQDLLGPEFQVSDAGQDGPGGFYSNFLPLRYRGRNCQVIWDNPHKLDTYRREADWTSGQEAVESYRFDYSFRDARYVLLCRSAAGNYVLLMLTRNIASLQSPPAGLFGRVEPFPDSLAAISPKRPPRPERILPLAREEESFRFVGVHAPIGFGWSAGSRRRFGPSHGVYRESDYANAFKYEVYALRDTAACRDSLAKYGWTDEMRLFEVVKSWSRQELEEEYEARGKKWRKRGARLITAMQALLGKDFEEVRRDDGYRAYLSEDNLRRLAYRGRNCQPVWDDPEKYRVSRSEQSSGNRQLGTVWYCTFDYYLRDARYVVLARTEEGNYLLLLMTGEPLFQD